MTEKLDIASAARKLKSPNIKTRKRALKAIHDLAKQKRIISDSWNFSPKKEIHSDGKEGEA